MKNRMKTFMKSVNRIFSVLISYILNVYSQYQYRELHSRSQYQYRELN